ncbi:MULTISPECIES: tellurite resistance TerB family protein [Oceanimonas]|uniref:TerB family tellurite resistance protein n=1 Tax=Oceanimonas smirnovii TaxID=264574 RepID=A0ABW7P174_9GAMM|nr:MULTISPECIES: TerB family tellurite resistance protein [Oceanimonas]MDV2856943.1 TerB family tellurite resistance protein [Oceanimonas sp. CAM02]
MIERIKQWLNSTPEHDTPALQEEVAVAALLSEVMLADGVASEAEHQRLEQLLARLFGHAPHEVHQWLQQGRAHQEEAVSLYEFTQHLKTLAIERREAILSALWQMAMTDGVLDPQEEGIVRQVAELLYIPHSRFIQLKLRVENGSED